MLKIIEVFFKEKGHIMLYIRFQTVKRGKKVDDYKKGHKKLLALKWGILFLKKVIQKIFSPPKLGAKSPPMFDSDAVVVTP